MKSKRLILVSLFCLFVFPAANILANQGSDTWLGVYTQTIDEDLQEAFDLDSNRGSIIKHVVPDSPADIAGLEQGDIIIKLGDKELSDSEDLSKIVGNMNSGEEVDIILIRNGKKRAIAATLGSGEKDNYKKDSIFEWYGKPHYNSGPYSKSQNYFFDEFNAQNTYIGISLEILTDQLEEYFGVKNGNGILITEVMEDSPANKAGLKAGDVITSVDGEKVTDISDVKKAVSQKEKGEEVEITLLRNKKKKELSVEVADAPESFNQPLMYHFPDPGNFHSFTPDLKGLFYGGLNDYGTSDKKHNKTLKKMQNEINELKKAMKGIQDKIN